MNKAVLLLLTKTIKNRFQQLKKKKKKKLEH